MGTWLKNIQGQLSDLASEILQEDVEEDEEEEEETELQEREKRVEAEQLLVAEKSKTENLLKQMSELEEQLYTTNLENEACREKFEQMIKDKDLQIKQLQMEVDKISLQCEADLFFKTDTLKVLDDLKESTIELKQNKRQLESNKKEYEIIIRKLEEFSGKEFDLNKEVRYLENSINLLKEENARKNQLIEELESQLEDLKHYPKDARSTPKNPSSYKIDDATLKQLFMSYFLAEKDKQPEIALVMASILGYSPEEQNSIRQSFDGYSTDKQDGGWFGLGSLLNGLGSPKSSTLSSSLTENFINFLQSESDVEKPTANGDAPPISNLKKI